MDSVEILSKQTQDAYDWINKLINSIPHNQWEIIPENIETSVSWQAGHLIMSFYFHSVMVIAGHQMDVLQKVPLKEYDKLFTTGEPKAAVGKVNVSDLHNQLHMVQAKSIDIIKSLSVKDLESELHPSPIPHPIAKNKFEALDWNVKHTMWHCGQLAILKRIINERFDFGLKR